MDKLYKYRSFDDAYLDNIIKNSSLYFSPVEYFNDPFDCKLQFKQNYSKREIKNCLIDVQQRNPHQPYRLKDMMKIFRNNQAFVELQNKATKDMVAKVGVLSLSKNCDSILMWSHYAQSHKGLVFEFTPKNLNDEKSCFYHPIKVDYSDSYDELSYAKEFREEILKLLLIKYTDWAYEEEYRCFGLDFQGEKQFQKNELTGIIFGVNASKKNIDRIMRLCKEHDYQHVAFRQASLDHGSFSLSFKDVAGV